jgi:ABC-2 type transport system permease protein
MRLSKSWAIASKDFRTFRRKRYLIYSILVLPIMISVLLLIVTDLIIHRSEDATTAASTLTTILPAFAFFYVILAGVIPSAIASYTIVGEKVERTLEPLLATPTTDGEILFGKWLSAFVPSVSASLSGSVVFMVLTDLATHGTLGYYYFPNWSDAIVLLLLVPLAVILSVEWNVIVSSKVTDVRVAQQIGALVILPLAGIYVMGEINVMNLGVASTLLIIAAIILLVDVLLFYLTRATFQREEILTKWK